MIRLVAAVVFRQSPAVRSKHPRTLRDDKTPGQAAVVMVWGSEAKYLGILEYWQQLAHPTLHAHNYRHTQLYSKS
jgi:hypothetical protein